MLITISKNKDYRYILIRRTCAISLRNVCQFMLKADSNTNAGKKMNSIASYIIFNYNKIRKIFTGFISLTIATASPNIFIFSVCDPNNIPHNNSIGVYGSLYKNE